MTPGKIHGATRELAAPSGWDTAKDGECGALQIRERGDYMQSAWYPTAEERAAIDSGRPVILTVWGTNHPPVSLTVSDTL